MYTLHGVNGFLKVKKLKMNRLLLIFVFQLSFEAFGQNVWFKHIDGVLSSQSFVIADTIYTFSNMQDHVMLTQTKTDSTFLKKDKISLQAMLPQLKGTSLSYLSAAENEGIFSLGLVTGDYQKFQTYLTTYHPHSGITDTLRIKRDTQHVYLDFINIINNEAYLFGEYDFSRASNDTRYESFIRRVNGKKPVWEKRYNFTSGGYSDWRVTSIFSNKRSGYFYMNQRYCAGTEVCQDYVVKMDTAGFEHWRVAPSFPRDSINPAGMQIIEKANGNVLVSWCDQYYRPGKNPDGNPNLAVPNDNATVWFAEIDQTGNVIMKKNIRAFLQKALKTDYTPLVHTRVIVTEDNGVIYTGNYFHNKKWYVPYLLKTDLSGNPIWYREYNLYPENDARINSFFSYDLSMTRDGGFLLTGSYSSTKGNTFNENVQKSTIVKLDYNGCLIPGCEKTDGLFKALNKTKVCKVYPNPSSQIIHIEAPLSKKYTIKLFAADGQLLIESNGFGNDEINTEALPDGLYLIVVSSPENGISENHPVTVIH